MAIRDALAKPGPWSIVAAVGLAVFLLAYWLFGWGYPSRSDLDAFLEYAFIREGKVAAFRDDGAEEQVDRSIFGTIGDVRCERVTRRRQPSIDYYCFYTSAGTSGARYRMVVMAVHNRGWKRNGMADVGDYRLTVLEAARQRQIFERYNVNLAANPNRDQSGGS